MAKILYIEDELTRNIATIKKFFVPTVLNYKIKKQLDDLESESRISAQDIVDVCEKSGNIHIAYNFPMALKLVFAHHMDYDLILIDRNLSGYPYGEHLDEMMDIMQKNCSSIAVDRIVDFDEREGDLLLHILLGIDAGYQKKTYFLTANVNDEIRNSANLKTLLEINSFKRDNIIEKGSSQESVLVEIIGNMHKFKIINEYGREAEIIRKWLSENDLDEFVKMIGHYQKNRRREFVFFLRKLIDNLLHSVAFDMGEQNASYWNPDNKKQLLVKTFIKSYKTWGLEVFNRKHDIGYNSIARNALLSIFEISSDCGVHDLSKAIDIESLNVNDISDYTMLSLLNQMRDAVLWYDVAKSVLSSI